MPYVIPSRLPLRLLVALIWVLLAVVLGVSVSALRGTLSARAAPPSAGESFAPIATSLPYVPHQLVLRAPRASAVSLAAEIDRGTSLDLGPASVTSAGSPGDWLLRLPTSAPVRTAAARIRTLPGIRYALPNYIAHAAGAWVPDDPGRGHQSGGWRGVQWNFLGRVGVDAPAAWGNLQADRRPGASGVVIAVLDTGVAFQNWQQYRRSPDFTGTKFVHPCDLIAAPLKPSGACADPHPLDHNGHGTIVTGEIAETTNNRVGLTGLAYRASIMPVRVLNDSGDGAGSTIASGIRYAVRKHAQVINLSLEFVLGTTAADIPEVLSAIAYANGRGVTVVGAAGNDAAGQGFYGAQLAYPARDPDVISVGATTKDLCLADYSNVSPGLDIVAPGGGDDSSAPQAQPANCHPNRNLGDIFQFSFASPAHPTTFGLRGSFGTSMATPDVSAAAAMVIASGLLGSRPTPTQILRQLEYSARPLSATVPNDAYGYGLLNVANATARVYTSPSAPSPSMRSRSAPSLSMRPPSAPPPSMRSRSVSSLSA